MCTVIVPILLQFFLQYRCDLQKFFEGDEFRKKQLVCVLTKLAESSSCLRTVIVPMLLFSFAVMDRHSGAPECERD